MATSPETPSSPSANDDLVSTAQFVFVGVVWGGIMLLILAWWLNIKYAAAPILWGNVAMIAGIAAELLAGWVAFEIWFKKESAQEKTASLTQQRRILSYILIGGGLGIIVLAFVLGVGKRGSGMGFIIDNLPETLGVLIFGLITLGAGYTLSNPVEQPGASVINTLTQAAQLIKLIMLIGTVGSIALIGWLLYKKVDYYAWWPEYSGLFLISLLSLACFLWLNTGAVNETRMRLIVLVFGGTFGLILFLSTIYRIIIWRQDIVLGGVEGWQGENSYRFWICSYVLFFSLVVMFASLNIARADIRFNVILRRVIYGFSALAQILLLIAILFTLIIVVYARYPLTFNWSKTRGAYALSDSSKALLGKLKQEANIFVLLPSGDDAYKDLRVLLDNCRAISNNKLNVTYISPGFDQKQYVDLVRKFPQITPDRATGGRGVLVVYGPLPKEDKHATPHAFVAASRILVNEGDPRGMPKLMFKGEAEILRELKFLAQEQKKRKILFLQGNDELNINDPRQTMRRDTSQGFGALGVATLAERLRRENYEVLGLSFKLEVPGQKAPNMIFAQEEGAEKLKEIPECHTLILAGTSKKLPSEVLAAIERYMARKGKLVVLADVVAETGFTKMKETGLELLLKSHGVELTNEFVLDSPEDRRASPTALLATPNKESNNPLARRFDEQPIVFRNSARVVRPGGGPGGFKAESILQIDLERFDPIVEKDVSILRDAEKYIEELMGNRKALAAARSKESVSVAVAVTEGKADKPRLVVIGDADFVSNLEMERSPTRPTNLAFVVGALEWMAERDENIGGLPKETAIYTLGPNVNLARMVFLPGWLMLLTLVGLGVGIWVVRRR